jgi:Domain of unknown function (DUF4136)
MRFPFSGLGVLLLAVPALLPGQKVTVEFDQSMEFGSLKSFTLKKGQIHSKNPSLNNDIVRKNLETAIRQRLNEKGLTEASGQADLTVSYTLGSANRTDVERYPTRWGGPGRRVAHRYTEGTLTIDMRDPRRQELVWRAVAVADEHDPNKIQSKLDAMVKKSFDKYPPKKK